MFCISIIFVAVGTLSNALFVRARNRHTRALGHATQHSHQQPPCQTLPLVRHEATQVRLERRVRVGRSRQAAAARRGLVVPVNQ